jgi:hypothetical protein
VNTPNPVSETCMHHTTLGGTIMRCVQLDCDGIHHYLIGS